MLSDLSKGCDRTRMATRLRDQKESATIPDIIPVQGGFSAFRSGANFRTGGAKWRVLRWGGGCCAFGFGYCPPRRHRGSSLSRVAGPRLHAGPILDLALDSPTGHVRGGEGGG